MKKGGIAAIVAVVVVIIAALLYWQTRPTGPTQPEAGQGNAQSPTEGQASQSQTPSGIAPKEQPSSSKPSGGQSAKKSSGNKSAAETAEPAVAYCRHPVRDHEADNAQAPSQKALAAQGGLVAILKAEPTLQDKIYDCGAAYLKAGGNIDATDTRAKNEHLTPLLYAIQRNDPKMVHFVIDHGASLDKRGGPDNTKPYGFAVFQALHNQSTNYNGVIAILDSAMRGKTKQDTHGMTEGDNPDTGADDAHGDGL